MATRIANGRPALRKAPRQQRSQGTVDTIIEAAARILATQGWAGFTTNVVAAKAGVSIGSLYQYFPNKLALAEVIRDRHLAAVLVALAPGEERVGQVSRRIDRLIDGLVAAHSGDQRLHRVLLDEVPFTTRAAQARFEAEYQARYRDFVVANTSGRGMRMSPAEADRAGWVLAAAVEGVVHAAARRGALASQPLRTELHRLIRGYLRAD
jgi:AcrR family transcriptional regulator